MLVMLVLAGYGGAVAVYILGGGSVSDTNVTLSDCNLSSNTVDGALM